VLWWLLQAFVVQLYTVQEVSMRPTLEPGERIVVLRPTVDRALQRGDVVVADVRGTWVPGRVPALPVDGTVLDRAPADAYVVKRVVALGGERVTCCPGGALVVDGMPLAEPYLRGAAGEEPYDVVVPIGSVWLLGDNRDQSQDARSHLGSPGGGGVGVDAVVGRVVGAG
jgi:signal peptidase I